MSDSTTAPDATAAATDAGAANRSPQEIQTDIDAAQQRLADQVDELSERLQPQALAEDALASVKSMFLEEDGTPKTKPIAIAVGSVMGLLVLRKLFHR